MATLFKWFYPKTHKKYYSQTEKKIEIHSNIYEFNNVKKNVIIKMKSLRTFIAHFGIMCHGNGSFI